MRPLWVLFVVLALGWTLFQAALAPLLFRDDRPQPWWAMLGGGIVYAAFMTMVLAFRRRRLRARGVDPADVRRVQRSVVRGVVPEDPRLRGEAVSYAHLAERNSARLLGAYPAVFGFLAVLAVVAAVVDHPDERVSWLIVAGIFVAMLSYGVVFGIRQRRGARAVLAAAGQHPAG